MIGSEHKLDVYLGGETIAELLWQEDQILLQYNEAWKQSGYAISPHLYLDGNIPTVNVQRFLRNLFPEGEGLDTLLTVLHLTRSNTFGLLRALGSDTPCAFWFIPTRRGLPETSSFQVISNAEIKNKLDARDKFSLIIWGGKPRLSVAGVQDKINVVVNAKMQIGFGEGKLSSTHILKFEKQKLSHLVINEYITMQLAKSCGLRVANVELLRFEEYPALLVERFDRRMVSKDEVKRLHIIDGCQALNLAPEYKYERNFGSGRDVAHIRDGASFEKLFNFANLCSNPADTKNKMLDWVLFNLLIYNFDAHGKNISFFVGQNGMTLAPFYDLVNINMYPEFEHEMAMGFGDEFDANAITAYHLTDFADTCQLSRSYLAKQLKSMARALKLALDQIDFNITCNDEEIKYLRKYQIMVGKRCDYYLEQVNEIQFIQL